MMTCLNANAYYLLLMLAAGVLAAGFRWGFARAASKYRQFLNSHTPKPNTRSHIPPEQVKEVLDEIQRINTRRTPHV